MVEHNWLLYIAAFACAFAITLVTTPFAKWLSVKCGAIDYPKDRGVHKKPMPRMGGVAIVLGFTITVLMVNYFDKSMDSRQFAGFLVGALLIAGLGVVDDMKNLPAKLKFCVQILAALIVIFSGTRIQVVLWPVTAYLQKFSIPITLVWIVGVTNAVNLIDGLDGLAAGVTSIAAMSLMVLCIAFARRRGYPKGERIPLRQALKIFIDALWGLITVVIILGGILTGVFTATESAAVACLWAFFVTMFIYRDYKWSELPKLMFRTVKTVTIVMILIGFAAAFGAVMTYMQLPTRITEFFTTLSDNKYVILMYLNIMLLLIGTLMDMAPIILILTPVLLPVANQLGIDPVHFGMIMMVNLGIGLITPPVGSVLFVASAVSKQNIETVVRAMLPFYGVLLIVLAMVTYIPAISLWLPRVLGMM